MKALKWFVVALVSCALVGSFCTGSVDIASTGGTSEASIVGMVIGTLVGIVVATALLPTIVQQSNTAQDNLTAWGSTAGAAIVGMWPLLLVVGVMIAIIGFVL